MTRCFSSGAERVPTIGHRRGEINGNLDGRSAHESVWATASVVDHRCRYYLVADLAPVRTRIRVRASRTGLREAFRPMALARIDRHQGLEIVVVIAEGAATGFSRVFTIRDGHLIWLRPVGRGVSVDRSFAFAGSVVNPVGADCGELRSHIVVSGAALNHRGTMYRVVRRRFDVVGDTFARVGKTQRLHVKPGQLRRFPEFSERPFSHCPPN